MTRKEFCIAYEPEMVGKTLTNTLLGLREMGVNEEDLTKAAWAFAESLRIGLRILGHKVELITDEPGRYAHFAVTVAK